MANLSELLAQKAALEKQIAQTQHDEREKAIGQVSALPDGDAGTEPAGLGAGREASLEQQAAVDAMKPMIPLGQFRDTYIIAVDADGIAIIDQHVAHDRVVYEQVMEQVSRDRVPGQRLLAPVVLELPAGPREALLAHRDDLQRLGYEIGEFGGRSIGISSVPALLGTGEATVAVRALADDLEGLDRGSRVEDALKRIAATTACHAAVRANLKLAPEKINCDGKSCFRCTRAQCQHMDRHQANE